MNLGIEELQLQHVFAEIGDVGRYQLVAVKQKYQPRRVAGCQFPLSCVIFIFWKCFFKILSLLLQKLSSVVRCIQYMAVCIGFLFCGRMFAIDLGIPRHDIRKTSN